MSSPDVVVLGLGNLLMQDEGVGIHALRLLQETYRFNPEIELIDGGTSGLDLLPFFRPESRMIMLDAMEFNQPPGGIGRVENEDILAREVRLIGATGEQVGIVSRDEALAEARASARAAELAAVRARVDDAGGWESLAAAGPQDRGWSERAEDLEDALEAWRKALSESIPREVE